MKLLRETLQFGEQFKRESLRRGKYLVHPVTLQIYDTERSAFLKSPGKLRASILATMVPGEPAMPHKVIQARIVEASEKTYRPSTNAISVTSHKLRNDHVLEHGKRGGWKLKGQ